MWSSVMELWLLVLWDIKLCGLVDDYQCFGGTCFFHLQERSGRQQVPSKHQCLSKNLYGLHPTRQLPMVEPQILHRLVKYVKQKVTKSNYIALTLFHISFQLTVTYQVCNIWEFGRPMQNRLPRTNHHLTPLWLL
jgi:hypothetical protein